MNETQKKLDRLADLQAQIDLINIRFDELRDAVLSPEIREKLAEIEAERQTTLEAVSAGKAQLETEIRQDVLQHGQTVKGSQIQAVFMKGRTSWDTKKLDGMMALIPQLGQARKEGQPSVSFRRVG